MDSADLLRELMNERDRRYAKEAELRADALKIKQQADSEALNRDREDRKYKDEQANKWREQVAQERVDAREREAKFLTKDEYDRRHGDLLKQVGALATVQSEGGGRAVQMDKFIAYGIGTVGVLAAIVSQLH